MTTWRPASARHPPLPSGLWPGPECGWGSVLAQRSGLPVMRLCGPQNRRRLLPTGQAPRWPGLGRLQDGVLAGSGPGRERRAEVAVVGILGRDRQALPVGERGGERPVGGGQVHNPRRHLTGRLARSRGELITLSVGGGLGFGGAEWGVVRARAAGLVAWACRRGGTTGCQPTARSTHGIRKDTNLDKVRQVRSR
jgi:hypothetical protein